MSREQRKAFEKEHGVTVQEYAAEQLNKLSQEIDNFLRGGDLVRLDVDRITSRSDYEKMADEYHAFVESSRDKVFTAHLYRKRKDGFSAVIGLVEEPRWLFWYGDLIRVKSEG